jgi:hypothetical protein
MSSRSLWLEQLLANLERCGPEGQAALNYLKEHHVKVGFHDQPTAARWTLTGQIQLHPRYADGAPEAAYPLSLILHEVKHLQQGFFVALSVYGELEAWQIQFSFLKSLTRSYHPDLHRNETIRELMSLPLSGNRDALRRTRQLMQRYAGRQYRIDLLPLYPLPNEIMFILTRHEFGSDNRLQN